MNPLSMAALFGNSPLQVSGFLSSLQADLNNFVASLFAFLPNLISAILILIIGYIIARVVSKGIRIAMQKGSVDKYVAKIRLGQLVARTGRTLTDLVATIVYWILFIITIVYAISALEIPPLTASMQGILAYLPNVIAAAIILLVGLIVGSWIGKGLENMLPKYGVSGARIIGLIVEVIIYLFALNLAAIQLGVGLGIIFVFSQSLAWGIAAAIAIGLGGAILFALKDVLPQMVAGRTTIASTVKPGQTIKVEGIPDKGDIISGVVHSVGMFNLVLDKGDGGYVVVPNELLADKTITVTGGEPPRPVEHEIRDRASDIQTKTEQNTSGTPS